VLYKELWLNYCKKVVRKATDDLMEATGWAETSIAVTTSACGCIPDKITCPTHAAELRKVLFDGIVVCPYCHKTDCTCAETA
jgi:hypothetical protein